MKLRKAGTLLLAVFLGGCKVSGNDLKTDVDREIAAASEVEAAAANYSNQFYAYYLEPSIGRVRSDRIGNLFQLNGTFFAMNLNVPQIINAAYYDNIVNQDLVTDLEAVYENEGTYTDHSDTAHAYRVDIYRKDDAGNYLVFRSDTVIFYAACLESECADLCGTMMRIARSMVVRRDEVILNYSIHQSISYNRKEIDLVQNYAPQSGVIDELFDDSHLFTATDSGGTPARENYATDNYPDTGNDVSGKSE